MGPIESLVLEAWGLGVQVDRQPPEVQAGLADILGRARALDEDSAVDLGAERSRLEIKILRAAEVLVATDANGTGEEAVERCMEA